MPGVFSSGKYALGICDICGWQYKLHQLREEYVKGRRTNIKACPKCWDPDNIRNFIDQAAREKLPDAQQLMGPRPDTNPAVVYNLAFVPSTVARNTSGHAFYIVGVFAGPSVTITADDPAHITFASPQIVSGSRVLALITVTGSAAVGSHTITVTDGTGAQMIGLLTID